MKITRRFFVAVVLIASLSLSASAQRQTKLYIDDGTGLFTILKAALGGGTLTFPNGTGMIVTEPPGSPVGTGLLLQPGTPGTAQTGNFNISGVGITGGLTDGGTTDIEGTTTINTTSGLGTIIGNQTANLTLTGQTVDIEDLSIGAVDINTGGSRFPSATRRRSLIFPRTALSMPRAERACSLRSRSLTLILPAESLARSRAWARRRRRLIWDRT